VLTTVKCAVVRLRVLMAQQSVRLITNPPIKEGGWRAIAGVYFDISSSNQLILTENQ
jgi:hypothetical protein